MILFIYLGMQLEDSGYDGETISFFDTVADRFVEFYGEQVLTLSEFTYDNDNWLKSHELYARCRNLIPAEYLK